MIESTHSDLLFDLNKSLIRNVRAVCAVHLRRGGSGKRHPIQKLAFVLCPIGCPDAYTAVGADGQPELVALQTVLFVLQNVSLRD